MNQTRLFIEVYVHGESQKLSLQLQPHKIECNGS